MNYANLISAMSAVIKANGNNEITGDLLQQVLRAMINSLGQGYQFMGVATTATNPGTQDARLFYVAEGPGIYSNFGPLTVPDDGQVYLLVLGASWDAVQLPIPTFAGFSDLVTEVAGKMALVPAATEGDVAEFGVAGQVRDGGVQTSALARRDAGAVAGNLAEFDGNGDPKDSGIAAGDVMKIPAGLMPFGPAGLAEALLDTDSAGAEQEFSLRKSGGDGGAYFRRLLGNTKAFNQLAQNGDFSDATGWTAYYGTMAVSGEGATVTIGEGYTDATIYKDIPGIVQSHKYFVSCMIKTGTAGLARLTLQQAITLEYFTTTSSTFVIGSTIFQPSNANTNLRIMAWAQGVAGQTIIAKNYILIDLTLMFGAGNEPSSVDEFKALFPLPYYAYGRKLIHNKVAKVITKGANQWDEVWGNYYWDNSGNRTADPNLLASANKIAVFPDTDYYIRLGSVPRIQVGMFHADGSFTKQYPITTGIFHIPSDVSEIVFCTFSADNVKTYANDICINLSDADINGQYFPYWERELALDITNREDTDGNKPFAEGVKSCPVASDEFNEVGGIVRVGVRPYQASDDTDASVITDGVDTAYALTTPVPFTWKEPLNTGIKVSKYGTEEITPAQTENIDNAPFRAVTTYTISVANLVAALGNG